MMESYARSLKELKLNPIRIGVVCSVYYENESRIREIMTKLKNFPGYVRIFTGGNKEGGDVYIKKYCLEFDIDYREYNPIYTKYNPFSAYAFEKYGKPFSKKAAFARYKHLISASEKVVLIDNVQGEKDEFVNYCKKLCDKVKKPYVIVN